MIDLHSIALAGFVSQATFALTFALLAWSDRRTRGMAWLAGAAVLQLLTTSSRTLPHESAYLQDAVGGVILILLFAFIYMGMRWFALRRSLRSSTGPILLLVTAALVLLIGLVRQSLALSVSRVAAICLIICTVRMLWTSRISALRVPLRVCAVLLSAVGGVTALRSILRLASSHSTAFDPLVMMSRAATMGSVSLLLFSFLTLFVAETNRRLHDETRLDILTGLRNRRALEEAAAGAVRDAAATGRPLALLMMDLDHFKKLNDTWGHGLGDRALRAMGSILLTVVGEDAFTARMGGEEFAVLLPGWDAAAAHTLAERVRATVEDLRLAEGEHLARFTVSVGVSVLQNSERGWTDLMARADDALYLAKHEGRNRVEVCPSGDSFPLSVRSAEREPRKHLLLSRQRTTL